MSNLSRVTSWLTVSFPLALVGCSSEPVTKPAANVSAEDQALEIVANLAKLSPEDRALAVAQKFCPVSRHELGSGGMGVPIALEVNGRKVLICCESCRDPILSEPDKYLAKLGPATTAPAEVPAVDK